MLWIYFVLFPITLSACGWDWAFSRSIEWFSHPSCRARTESGVRVSYPLLAPLSLFLCWLSLSLLALVHCQAILEHTH